MTLIASNLGQILGRLMLAAEPPAREAGPQAPHARVVVCGAARRQRQILELIVVRGPVRCADVAQALGISGDNAGVVLNLMHRRGVLARSGAPRLYTYALP